VAQQGKRNEDSPPGVVEIDRWLGIEHGKFWSRAYPTRTLILLLLAIGSAVVAGLWPALAVVGVVIPWNEWTKRWHRLRGRAHPLFCVDQLFAVTITLFAPEIVLGTGASIMACGALGVVATGERTARMFTIGAAGMLAAGTAIRGDWNTLAFALPLLGCALATEYVVVYLLAKQRSSGSRFEDLLDGIHAAVVEIDLESYLVIYLNPHAELLLAGKPTDLSTLVSLIHSEDRDKMQAALSHVIESPTKPMNVDLRTQVNGTEHHLAARATVSGLSDRRRLRLVLMDVSERKHIELELEHRATHDALTELPNRVLIRQRMDLSIHGSTSSTESEDESNSPSQPAVLSPLPASSSTPPSVDQHHTKRAPTDTDRHAVLVLDLDSFKDINDGLGHHHGDLLLIEIAERLRQVVRPCDTVARLGGDEFAVWLDGCDEVGAREIATRIQTAVAVPHEAEGVVLYPEVSIGIACFPTDANTTAELLRLADMAMYRAKRTGTGYAMYASELDGSGPTRFALQSELRDAIRCGALQPYFQPLVDVTTGSIISCEALVRWHHGERGILTPAEFWPVVQAAGLSSEVASTMLRSVFGHLREWHRQGIAVPVAVNLSTSDVCDESLVDLIEHELAQSAYPAGLLTVELTETELLAQTAVATAALQRLGALGVATAVDDFGTGYSSLAWLRDLPVTTVKIDRSFVGNLADDRTNAIVRSTIALARDLGLDVVGEGVEDNATAVALSSLGCDRMQGYLFSRPVPPSVMEEKLRSGVARSIPAAVSSTKPATT
jgi:diguanylate cyclase (GGDEF)-like protein